MIRGVWLAALAVVVVVVTTGLAIAMSAASEPEPQPTPSRVYSSCLAADTRPLDPGDDPCEGSGN
ncbi:hypothetical protein [Streptomyces endophyticus]|uniref:Uncharacterized protein n=1 Tax=Streptomyces endophyticus TaxID=714166 RepID=A0ABU6F2S5_9ACTN|nr:hypothetical protein [Streptomyces endophyticus]MEB8338283.1 hypothetical protein [Streptomyces endophyticus]